jgi:hypothetical protein
MDSSRARTNSASAGATSAAEEARLEAAWDFVDMGEKFITNHPHPLVGDPDGTVAASSYAPAHGAAVDL